LHAAYPLAVSRICKQARPEFAQRNKKAQVASWLTTWALGNAAYIADNSFIGRMPVVPYYIPAKHRTKLDASTEFEQPWSNDR
jgi:hypothetical protein